VIYLPLVLSPIFVVLSRLVCRRTSPRPAAWSVTVAMVLLAGSTMGTLVLLAWPLAARLSLVAQLGGWRPGAVNHGVPVPEVVSITATAALAAVAAVVVRQGIRLGRGFREIANLHTVLAPTGAPAVAVVEDLNPSAHAVPGTSTRPGVVVMSTGLLEVLDPEERAAVLAHEHAHLAHGHRVFVIVAELAAAGPKRTSLELGGKSASILLDDLSGDSLAGALAGSLTGCLINSGQTCSALTRLLVPRAVIDEVLANLEVFVQFAPMGDPLDPATQQGPLVSKVQQERVRDYIRSAIDDGARLVAGGPEQPAHLPKGFFVQPTVLLAEAGSRIEQEEVFGPVLTVVPYDGSDEDAIRIANGTPYGLSGAVWAADRDRALRVARRLRTGQVGVNGGTFNPTAPFGGFGQSGYGRELGHLGIEEFTALTSIQL